MTFLYSAQKVTDPRAYLNPGTDGGPPFAVVELSGPLTTLTFHTRAEAYALRRANHEAGVGS